MPLTTPLPQEKTSWKPHDFRLIPPPPPRRIHRKMAENWRENCAQEAAVRISQILTHFPVYNDCLSRLQISKDAAMNADIFATWVCINVEYRLFNTVILTDAWNSSVKCFFCSFDPIFKKWFKDKKYFWFCPKIRRGRPKFISIGVYSIYGKILFPYTAYSPYTCTSNTFVVFGLRWKPHCKDTISKNRNKYSSVPIIYSHNWFAYSATGKYVDQSWEYINRSHSFPSKQHILLNWTLPRT